MCTLVALAGVLPGLPLVMAANRDEVLSRPTAPPAVLDVATGAVGGRDLEKGGTWLGVRPDGFFCGLTNLRPEGPLEPGARSRGEVVLAVLRAPTVAAAAAHVERLDARAYNGFNLLFGTAEDLRAAHVRPATGQIEVVAVPPGINVLPTGRLNDPGYPKVARLRAALAPADLPADWPALSARLVAALADHRQPAPASLPEPAPGARFDRPTLCALDAVCIHLEAADYGTRSSTLLAVAPGRVLHYAHADGPPCRTPFADLSALLRPPPPHT